MCTLDLFEGAIAKSARAAGISAHLAEKYAAEMVQKLPGKKDNYKHIDFSVRIKYW